MRIYLAGVGGMLGEALHTVLGEKHELMCTDIDVNEPWFEKCDFRNFIEYEHQVSTFRPEMLMHIGAHTSSSIASRIQMTPTGRTHCRSSMP